MSPIRRPRNRQSLTPRRSCTALPLLGKRLILSFFLQNRSLREESRQEAVKVETQTAPDAEMGWSRRRHASRQSSDCVSHKATCSYLLVYFMPQFTEATDIITLKSVIFPMRFCVYLQNS